MSAEQTTPTTPTTTTWVDLIVEAGVPGAGVELKSEPLPDGRTIDMAMPHAVWVGMGNPNTFRVTLETRCDGCGCVDSEACLGGCSWAAPGLCSRCV